MFWPLPVLFCLGGIYTLKAVVPKVVTARHNASGNLPLALPIGRKKGPCLSPYTDDGLQ